MDCLFLGGFVGSGLYMLISGHVITCPRDKAAKPCFPMLFKGFRITVRFPMPPKGCPLNQPCPPSRTCGNLRFANDFHRASGIFLWPARGGPALPSLPPSFRSAENVVLPMLFEGSRITVRFPGLFFSWTGRKRCFPLVLQRFQWVLDGLFFFWDLLVQACIC